MAEHRALPHSNPPPPVSLPQPPTLPPPTSLPPPLPTFIRRQAGPAASIPAGNTKFSQINLQHCKAATAVLCRDLAVEQTDIALIQEPWTNGGLIRGIDRNLGSLIHADAGLGPRACIFVSKLHSALRLNQFCTRDLAAARISLIMGGRRTELVICSAYLPFDSAEPPPTIELVALVDYTRANGLDLIIGCDANSHHTVWGSSNINQRGAALLEYLSTTRLEILNRGSRPTFVTSRRQEVLDLTLATPEAARAILDWRVSEEETLSDHRLIKFSIAGSAAHRPPDSYRNPRATDWTTYKEGLAGKLAGGRERPGSRGEIEREVNFLRSAMIDSYEAANPLKKRVSRKTVAWWNRDLTKARTRSRKLLNKALKTNTVSDWDSYREAQRDYKKLIRRSKLASWRDFCCEIEALPLVARLRRIFASGPSTRLDGLVLPDGRTTASQEETLAHLFEVHFPGSVLTEQGQPTGSAVPLVGTADRDWETAMKIVTSERIKWALDTFDRYKSPGVDGIFPALLQEAGEGLIKHLRRIYRACLALCYIPAAWREVRVVFIPKPGKDTYDRAKSFRPISLTSFLLKTLERLVDRHIREGALVARPVHHSQHAYQVGKSVETALHHTVKVLEGAVHTGKSVLSVFIDIEGAFDNTSFVSICEAARGFGVEDSVTNWIHCMLRTRTVTAGLRESTASALVKKGCPQGGVTSPILWVMVIDGLLAELERLGVMVVGYADDVAMLVIGTHPGEMSWKMQRALDHVQTWCTSKSLRVNPGKTEMVLFTNRRKLRVSPPSIFGTELGFSTEVRYLGVTLDSKLRWRSHIERQARKAIATFWACRRMFSSTWGLKPAVVKWIHTAIIEPQVTYASIVWWPALQRETNKKALNKVYRLALLGISGALRTTPTLALGALLNVASLDITARAKAMCAALRLKFGGKWRKANRGHASLLNGNGYLDEVLALGGDRGSCSYHFHRNYTVTFPSRQEWEDNSDRLLSPGGLVWYTDGSKTITGAGAGVWSEGPRTRLSLALGTHTTILQAEVLAIRTCAEEILRRGDEGGHIYICCDSRAALKALDSIEVRSELTRSCVIALTRIASVNRVKLLWVPGHTGIRGNSEADRLARLGSVGPAAAIPTSVPVAPGVIKEVMGRWTAEQFTTFWLTSPGAGHARALFTGPTERLGSELIALERNKLRWLVGLITGHWFTGQHLRRMGWEVDSLCRVCGVAEETPLHLITACEGLEGTRLRTLGAPSLAALRLEETGIGGLIRFAEEAELMPQP